MRLFKLHSEATDAIAAPQNEATTTGVLFDLQGRPVATPSKGFYIKDGKKWLIQ